MMFVIRKFKVCPSKCESLEEIQDMSVKVQVTRYPNFIRDNKMVQVTSLKKKMLVN